MQDVDQDVLSPKGRHFSKEWLPMDQLRISVKECSTS